MIHEVILSRLTFAFLSMIFIFVSPILPLFKDPTVAPGDAGIARRYAHFKLGHKRKLYVPIMTGICSQQKLLPNLVNNI